MPDNWTSGFSCTGTSTAGTRCATALCAGSLRRLSPLQSRHYLPDDSLHTCPIDPCAAWRSSGVRAESPHPPSLADPPPPFAADVCAGGVPSLALSLPILRALRVLDLGGSAYLLPTMARSRSHSAPGLARELATQLRAAVDGAHGCHDGRGDVGGEDVEEGTLATARTASATQRWTPPRHTPRIPTDTLAPLLDALGACPSLTELAVGGRWQRPRGRYSALSPPLPNAQAHEWTRPRAAHSRSPCARRQRCEPSPFQTTVSTTKDASACARVWARRTR